MVAKSCHYIGNPLPVNGQDFATSMAESEMILVFYPYLSSKKTNISQDHPCLYGY